MPQDHAESTRVTISYGRFIYQSLPDTIKSIGQVEKTYTKICRQTCLYCSMKYIYIYIYIDR